MEYSDFLFEIGVEELPSKAVLSLSEALLANVKEGLLNAKIEHGEAFSFGTPRRLAILIKNVARFQAMQTVSKRGPTVIGSMDKDNNPLPSLQGFAKSCNVEIDSLTTIKTDKGEWWFYEAQLEGSNSRDILFSIIKEAVNKLPIAKLMTWGEGYYNFSRPVHWGLMLFGEECISGEMLGIETSSVTYGHRFHHPEEIKINKPDEYVNALYSGKVIADFNTRRAVILEQIQKVSNQYGLMPIIPEALIEEVCSIVEWPCAVFADFSPDFLQIPEEVIIESLQQHQKCFALKDASGKLAPHFITIANIESKNPQKVKLGNEKVVRARLSDAVFFYQQDAKISLADYASTLDKVVFHAKLGSVADKVARITRIMQYLAPYYSLDENIAKRASFLSKSDLLTGMVGEFPELQGIMGEYYARNDGEPKEVSLAIKEQYYPRFAGDELPQSNYGLALSLADRIDTLVGLFAIGQKPSGVKDPYKLRRHALAVVRILLLAPNVSLKSLVEHAAEGYSSEIMTNKDNLNNTLQAFIFERMLSFYQANGVDSQYFYAVKTKQSDSLYDLNLRIKALLEYKKIPEAEALSAACKRVDNLLVNSKVDNTDVSPNLLIEPAEHDLFSAVVSLQAKVDNLINAASYADILLSLASIKNSVDAFFDTVMVMVSQEEIKQNRLNLLFKLQTLLKTVADIALIHDFSA